MRIVLDCLAMLGFVFVMMMAGYMYQYHQFAPKCGTAFSLFTKECV